MINTRILLSFIFISFSFISRSQTGSCNTCTNGTKSSNLQINKSPNPLNGSGTLGLNYQFDTCGLNYVQASVLTQTRSAQYNFNANGTGFPTNCGITGMPGCAIIIKAWVYYISSYQSPQAPVSTVSITNPLAVNSVLPSTNIGTDGSKCWSETGTANYRCDVTSAIAGNGNYIIDINGFTNKNWEIDGVTLFIVYRDPLATYQGSLVMWDGCLTGIGSNEARTMTGVNACAASAPGTGRAFLCVSDMQSNVNGNQHPSTLNGNTANYVNNFYSWDQVNTNVTNGQTNSNFGTDGSSSDCFTWILMGLYYRTTTCVTCTPVAPSPLTVTTTATASPCNQPIGTATATPAGGLPPYTYNWNTVPAQTTPTATGLVPGTYIVNVIDATGCSLGTDTIVVPVIVPVATFTGTDTTGCAPICVTFANTTPSTSSCSWDFGDGTSLTGNCNPVHCYLIPGTYSVTLYTTDGFGCTSSAQHVGMVIVYALPVANFSANPQPASWSYPTVNFTDLSTGGVTNWFWTFGDPGNSTSTQQNPTFTYTDPGTYTVTLVVQNATCTDTATLDIIIEDDFAFFAPNCFTPNNDSHNDIFLPQGVMWDMSSYDLWIFDRWGNKIFHTTTPTEGWNGKVQGGNSNEIAQEDTYVWKVSVSDTHGRPHQYIGHVSIVR